MARLLNINKENKWEKEYTLSLTLKEIQLLHDALWGIPYNSLCEGAEYDAKDEVYSIGDFDVLCNDFNNIVRNLGGYITF